MEEQYLAFDIETAKAPLRPSRTWKSQPPLGTAKTRWVADAGVAPGQSITILARFVPEYEPEQFVSLSAPPAQLDAPPISNQRTIAATSDVQAATTAIEVERPAEIEAPLVNARQPTEVPVASVVEQSIPRAHLATSDLQIDTAVAAPANVGASVDELPREKAFNRPPAYPTDALRDNREGRVMIRALIADDGHVTQAAIETSSGTPSLDSAALAAVVHWHFSPARRAGLAIDFEIIIPVRFRIGS